MSKAWSEPSTDFDLDVERRIGALGTVGSEVASNDDDLVVMDADAARSISSGDLDPGTRYVFTDDDGARFDGLPNVTTYEWAQEQAGFLAGVAAATTTRTGTVAFLGAVRPEGDQDQYRAGFEAGARSIRPDITLLSAYLADFGYESEPYDDPEDREVAGRLYGSNRGRHLPRRRALRCRGHRGSVGPEFQQALRRSVLAPTCGRGRPPVSGHRS